MLNRHIHSHYPEAYFCPVCRSVLSRPDAFLRHFKGDAKCADTNKGRYFGLPPPPNQKQFFNVYSLGLMEQYPMPGEHFRIIAGRHRGEPLVLSALFPTTTSSAGFIVTL
ncbi:hypothetical protein DFH11DRAFT_376036 [Phellopilus nigrolimitatus]|nr:hypothetical protein DFH11DRAFT_376036 [Phellopilus nigrolimitatus]